MSQMGTEHLFFILFQNVEGKKRKVHLFSRGSYYRGLTGLFSGVLWVSILSHCKLEWMKSEKEKSGDGAFNAVSLVVKLTSMFPCQCGDMMLSLHITWILFQGWSLATPATYWGIWTGPLCLERIPARLPLRFTWLWLGQKAPPEHRPAAVPSTLFYTPLHAGDGCRGGASKRFT